MKGKGRASTTQSLFEGEAGSRVSGFLGNISFFLFFGFGQQHPSCCGVGGGHCTAAAVVTSGFLPPDCKDKGRFVHVVASQVMHSCPTLFRNAGPQRVPTTLVAWGPSGGRRGVPNPISISTHIVRDYDNHLLPAVYHVHESCGHFVFNFPSFVCLPCVA